VLINSLVIQVLIFTERCDFLMNEYIYDKSGQYCEFLFFAFQFVVADVQKYLGQLSELLPTMRETISLGTQPELTEESNCGKVRPRNWAPNYTLFRF